MKHARALFGFSLIELVVVLGLLAITLTLAPMGLSKLYEKSDLDAYTQKALNRLTQCAQQAKQEQRTLSVQTDSNDEHHCALPQQGNVTIVLSQTAPIFYSDGTSNGASIGLQSHQETVSIRLNKLSSRPTLESKVKSQ